MFACSAGGRGQAIAKRSRKKGGLRKKIAPQPSGQLSRQPQKRVGWRKSEPHPPIGRERGNDERMCAGLCVLPAPVSFRRHCMPHSGSCKSNAAKRRVAMSRCLRPSAPSQCGYSKRRSFWDDFLSSCIVPIGLGPKVCTNCPQIFAGFGVPIEELILRVDSGTTSERFHYSRPALDRQHLPFVDLIEAAGALHLNLRYR